jgi:branched-chain amino acid transport system substrate-binding protein
VRAAARRGRPRVVVRVALVALAAMVMAGCGDRSAVDAGGEIGGSWLTVHSLLPPTQVARDMVDAQKLALLQDRGRAGAYRITVVSDRLEGGRGALANRVRGAINDPQMIAAIADLDSHTARVTIPMLNEAGILDVSPGATYPGFTSRFPGSPPGEPERWQPAAEPTFAPLLPNDAAQAEAIARAARPPVAVESEVEPADQTLADMVRRRVGDDLTTDTRRARTIVYAGSDPESAAGVVEALLREAPNARILLSSSLLRAGMTTVRRRVAFVDPAGPPDAAFVEQFEQRFDRCPHPYAHLAHEAMQWILDAITEVGERAGERRRVVRAYMDAHPPEQAGARPFFLVSGRGCDWRYDPVR